MPRSSRCAPGGMVFHVLGRIKGVSDSLIYHLHSTKTIAVGTVIADRPPHRSVRAELPHTAPTSDVDLQTAHWDKDAGSSASVASVCLTWKTSPMSGGDRVDCDVAVCGATSLGARLGIGANVRSCPAPRNTGTSRDTHSATNHRPEPGRHAVSESAALSSQPAWLEISSATSCGGS